MLVKVEVVRKQFPRIDVQVDGGVKLSNVGKCAQAGANCIVSGTGIVKQADMAATVQQMKEIVNDLI